MEFSNIMDSTIMEFDCISFHISWDRSRYQNITYMYWRSLAFMIGNISCEAVPPNADCWVNNNYHKENHTEVHWRPCAMCLGEVQRIHNCRGRDNCTNAQQSLIGSSPVFTKWISYNAKRKTTAGKGEQEKRPPPPSPVEWLWGPDAQHSDENSKLLRLILTLVYRS